MRAAAAVALVAVMAAPPPAYAFGFGKPKKKTAAVAPVETFETKLGSRLWTQLEAAGERDLVNFYAARHWRPVWFEGGLRPEARQLLAQVRGADADGLNPRAYPVDQVAALLPAAEAGDLEVAAQAEAALTRLLSTYAVDLRRGQGVALAFVDPQLKQAPATVAGALASLGAASSLKAHIEALPALNPIYVSMRQALASYRDRSMLTPVRAERGAAAQPNYERLLLANLERARALPPTQGRRYIIVNTAAAKLWLVEDGRVVDSMKVIVGKREQPTPMLAVMARDAIFNPYWNVPDDLARNHAAKVVKQGLSYLKSMRMEVLADYSENAPVLDPAKVDWKAVASGKTQVRMRQLPGGANMMGKVKLAMANPQGIYLHDTPNKAAFNLQERLLSSGCVRLEDALRLARHLVPDPPQGLTPADGERIVTFAEPVPIYITYLTLNPEAGGLVHYPDIYRNDAALLAALDKQGAPTGPTGRAVTLTAGAAAAGVAAQ